MRLEDWLRTEIKKLQKLRETVKGWAAKSDIRNKQPLVDAREVRGAGGRTARARARRAAPSPRRASLPSLRARTHGARARPPPPRAVHRAPHGGVQGH
jgi:hypothetical protein